MSPDTAAIVLGAGQGLRFGGHVRKQYLRLQGRPVLWWSLAAFQASPSIDTIVLVAPREDLPRLTRQVATWRFSKLNLLVAGGKERSDSVKEGLAAVSDATRWVAVHDGVRPLITPAQIESVLAVARKYKAAIAAVPSRDTVKIADRMQCIAASPDRRSVWQAQTPQIFAHHLLRQAHGLIRGAPGSRLKAPGILPKACSLEPKAAITDDAQLVERLGVKVKLVDTSAENMKVTLPIDLEFAKIILKRRRRK